jgi:hypothetical protein
VCLYYLNDSKNAVSIFEKSIMLPDAIRNPLIYLNFAIFTYQIKKYEESQQYLDIFYQMIQHISTNKEVRKFTIVIIINSINYEPKTMLQSTVGLFHCSGRRLSL